MQKKKIYIAIFLILLAGTLYYYYSNYTPNNYDSFNVSIRAIDSERDIVITGFEIQPINLIKNSSNSYQTFTLLKGIYTIKNKNIKNQKFYEESKKYNLTKNTRIDLILEEPKEVKIEKDYNYSENVIYLNIYSENFKDVDFCLKGSINYLFIQAVNFTEKKIKGFENYDVCYEGNFSLKDSNKLINISFKPLKISRDDFINLTLIDVAGNEVNERII